LSTDDYKELITTVSKVGTGLPRYKRLAFSQFLDSNDIVCAGYSNGDVDTFPIIAGTPQKIFWYKFSLDEEIINSVKMTKEKLQERLVIVDRLHHESGFGELLCSLDQRVFSEFEKAIVNISLQNETKPSDRINEMESILTAYLGETDAQRSQRSRLFLATLLDELGQREDSLQILRLGTIGHQDKTMIYAENMVAGHVEERLGNIENAIKHFSLAQKNANQEKEKYEARLEKSSANLGAWKRSPYKFSKLFVWLVNIKLLSGTGFDKIEQRRLWEIGDFAHFIADYLMIPSALAVRKIKHYQNYAFFLKTLDHFSLFLFRPIRMFLLKLSAHYYFLAIKLALRLDEDTLPNYTGLAYIRASEVMAALEKKPQAKYLLLMAKKGENFYEWIQSQHGVANATCASAIVSFYSKDYSTAQSLLDLAAKQYGSHAAGVLKCKIYSFRLNFWHK
jgi:hypothetical protein